jgi:hypothetical protein
MLSDQGRSFAALRMTGEKRAKDDKGGVNPDTAGLV